MYRSLERHLPSFTLWILCLDDASFASLSRVRLRSARVISLRELEAADPAFAQTARDRSRIEYYFTSTPVFLSFVLSSVPAGTLVTYLDADLFFFASPVPLFESLDGASCGLIEHRFPDRLAMLTSRGIYNVGWVSLRKDRTGLACAAWWRDRCLDWCHDRIENGRFADQKYLDAVPLEFPGVKVLGHPGANLAPWNLERHHVSAAAGRICVDGQPLVFFHFHGLRQVSRYVYAANFGRFLHRPNGVVMHDIYGPYLRALATEQFSNVLARANGHGSPGPGRGAYLTLREMASPSFALELLKGRNVLFYRGHPVVFRPGESAT